MIDDKSAFEDVTIRFEADTKQLRSELKRTADLSRRFSREIASAFTDAVIGGKSLSATIRDLSRDLAQLVLDSTLQSALNHLFGGGGGIFSGKFPGFPGLGGSPAGSPLGFARGGILTQASHFTLPSGRVGVAGEAGPEAILPLRRGADGRLGVGGGNAAQARPVQIIFNIATPDVEGFRRSQGQISAQMLRILRDGRRNL